jgi:hypothetical protein
MNNVGFKEINQLYKNNSLPAFLSNAIYSNEIKFHNGIFKELSITYRKREYIESPCQNIYIKFYNHHFTVSCCSKEWSEKILLCEKYRNYNNLDDLFLKIKECLKEE